jgi:hypothetical protein
MALRVVTSTAWVGSSHSNNVGFIAKALANTTFCWLPPLNSDTGCSLSLALMASACIQCLAKFFSRLRSKQPNRLNRCKKDKLRFSRTRIPGTKAL